MTDDTTTSEKLIAIEAIQKKLMGKQLSQDEIYALIHEIAHNKLGDVLTTFFAASFFKEGFNEDELYFMTRAMVETGERMRYDGIVADKHSIGGIAGTRATMIIVPIMVAAGYTMPKTSSRAITSPAGTADVMEVLAPVSFPPSQIKKIVDKVGGCIVWGGKLGIAPADDVIITVEEELSFESIEKVIVSIMAKKVAAGSNHLILDLPYGKTLKLKTRTKAREMATMFERIAHRFDIKTVIDINEMNEPAGRGIGPVMEAKDVLMVLEQSPNRPLALEKKSLHLAKQLLELCQKTEGKHEDAMEVVRNILTSGRALEVMKTIIKAQGGDPNVTSESIQTAKFTHTCHAAKHGTISAVDNFHLNSLAKIVGAPEDRQAGLFLHKKIGEPISKDDTILTIFSNSSHAIQEAIETIKQFPIYVISN
jgi:putative thymidine phosphorylase